MMDPFDLLKNSLAEEGPNAVFDRLLILLREQKNYPLLLEARLMCHRHANGLPLFPSGAIGDLPAEHQAAYQAALRDAAREAGELFLGDGDIVRSWPYFRAISNPAPVAEAIERLPAAQITEPVLQIALQERVHPRKGFEALLEQQGLCAAIGFAASYPDRDARVQFLQALVRTLTRDLAANLKAAIATAEGRAPETASVATLLTGRDWLFAGARFYIENSHLTSLVQASPDLPDRESLQFAWELTEYGRRLDPMFAFPSNPPFADTYVDFGAYLRALLGDETGLIHFRQKVANSVPGSAEILVGLLTRLGRYAEAVDVSVDHLAGEAGSTCRSAVQLCQMAGDYPRLRALARQDGDLLAFTAAMLQGPR